MQKNLSAFSMETFSVMAAFLVFICSSHQQHQHHHHDHQHVSLYRKSTNDLRVMERSEPQILQTSENVKSWPFHMANCTKHNNSNQDTVSQISPSSCHISVTPYPRGLWNKAMYAFNKEKRKSSPQTGLQVEDSVILLSNKGPHTLQSTREAAVQFPLYAGFN